MKLLVKKSGFYTNQCAIKEGIDILFREFLLI